MPLVTWLKACWRWLRPAPWTPRDVPGALTDNQRDNRTLTESYRAHWFWRRPLGWPWNYQLAGLTVLALAGVVGANYGGLFVSRHSPHPLSRAHAAWEGRCEVCHAPTALGIAPARKAQCQACHPGPEHNSACHDLEAECSTCHREHRGGEASLVRHDDSHCTRCHSPAAKGATVPSCQTRVTSFTPDGHPPFRPVARDPGGLQFNHALHMTQGLVRVTGDKLFTLEQVAKDFRERYQEPAKNAGVQLKCASCHQADREDWDVRPPSLPKTFPPPRSPGAYMQPVVYESHCQACHPLTFDPRLPDRAVPHRLPPADVRRYLEGVYADKYVRDNPSLRENWLSQRPLPGKLPPPPDDAAIDVRGQVEGAERLLFRGKNGCAECHHFNYDRDPTLPASMRPTAVPAVWLTNATFGHAAHHALDCRACHADADVKRIDGTDNPGASKESKTVLVPNADTCFGCHRTRPDGKPLAGMARSDCTGCHSYHNVGSPLTGAGATARDPDPKPGLPGLPRGPGTD
ncbi:MAG TPA: hypothetical protein VFW33_03720 [Gemmataceae bacterium]|nr:hypothetical protein [Gemmataceae bacterium]